jgi:hypothetical protein
MPDVIPAEFSYRALNQLMVFYGLLTLGTQMWFCLKMLSSIAVFVCGCGSCLCM